MATLIDTRDPRRHPEMLTNQSLVRPQYSLAGAGRGMVNPALPTDPMQPMPAPLSALATTPDAAPAATPTAASPGTTPAPATPPAPAALADVARQGNSYSGGNVSGPITVNGQAPGGSYTESLGTQAAAGAGRPLSALATPTPNADAVIAASTRLNQGAGVIDGAGGDARQKFFDEANLRNAAAQGSWSPRRGYQGNDAAVGAAAIPLVNRARQQLADTASNAALQRTSMEQTGADNRAASAERAADARFGIANQQQQVQNSLAERRLELDDRRVAIEDRKANNSAGGKVGELSTGIRKEFEALPEVKNYKQALPAFKGIQDAVKRNTPMSDINLVYGIAKLYDPNSVVREGEYSTVANAPGMPERVKGWAQYLQGGGKLTPDVKQQILSEAGSRMQTFEKEYSGVIGRYSDIAGRSGADASLVVPQDFKFSVPPAPGAVEGGFRFKGGNPSDQANWERM